MLMFNSTWAGYKTNSFFLQGTERKRVRAPNAPTKLLDRGSSIDKKTENPKKNQNGPILGGTK